MIPKQKQNASQEKSILNQVNLSEKDLQNQNQQNLIESSNLNDQIQRVQQNESQTEDSILQKRKKQDIEQVEQQVINEQPVKKKRGRKKGKGKELQDLLQQYQDIQKTQAPLSQHMIDIQQASATTSDIKQTISQIEFLDTKTRPKRNTLPTKYHIIDNTISSEEERMLKLAIKNSLLESQNTIATLDDIQEVKTYYPSEEEFISPINYIEKLYKQGAYQYGIIKIVPPKSFRPILAFDQLSPQKLPCRYQILQDLAQGKPFNYNQEGHTFTEFAQLSKQIENEQTQDDFWKLEKEYWNYVENQVGPKIKVEYAADLSVTTYGSGFLRENQPVFDYRTRQYQDHPWNLNNLFKQQNSLMQFPGVRAISGINIPWLYIGMKYSTFCWHFEDLMLYSINYNHWGKPKLWYGVPEDQRDKFDKAVKSKIALLFKKDPNILLDIITMVSPAYLLQQKVQFCNNSQQVKVYKTLQMPGEFILTFPGAYHAGFSTGLNIGEAVNFVSKSWVDYGLKCQDLYRKSREKIPVFPIDWLIVENLKHIDKIHLDLESKVKLREVYSKILKDEKKARETIEKLFKGKNDNQGYEILPNRENISEDANQCHFCTDIAYLSVIQCKIHKYNYCLQHQLMCGCSPDSLKLYYRYSTQEMENYEKVINESCSSEVNNENGVVVKPPRSDRIKKKIFTNIEETKMSF